MQRRLILGGAGALEWMAPVRPDCEAKSPGKSHRKAETGMETGAVPVFPERALGMVVMSAPVAVVFYERYIRICR